MLSRRLPTERETGRPHPHSHHEVVASTTSGGEEEDDDEPREATTGGLLLFLLSADVGEAEVIGLLEVEGGDHGEGADEVLHFKFNYFNKIAY